MCDSNGFTSADRCRGLNSTDITCGLLASDVGERQCRKEVRNMKYAKPEIVAVIPAATAILGSKVKGTGMLSDAPLNPPIFHITPGAYEADE